MQWLSLLNLYFKQQTLTIDSKRWRALPSAATFSEGSHFESSQFVTIAIIKPRFQTGDKIARKNYSFIVVDMLDGMDDNDDNGYISISQVHGSQQGSATRGYSPHRKHPGPRWRKFWFFGKMTYENCIFQP